MEASKRANSAASPESAALSAGERARRDETAVAARSRARRMILLGFWLDVTVVPALPGEPHFATRAPKKAATRRHSPSARKVPGRGKKTKRQGAKTPRKNRAPRGAQK